MKTAKIFLLTIIISTLLLPGTPVEKSRENTPGFKDILNLESPRGPMISPDGKYILYSVRKPDWDKNSYLSQIWMAVISTGEIKQMTFAEKSSFGCDWSPDSRFISFISARDEKPQLYVMSATGGEARKVSDLKTGIDSYEWSPCGKKIAFTAPAEKSKKKKGREKKYGKFEVIDNKSRPAHLWMMDIETGKTEKLVDAEDLHFSDFIWFPDGTKIAFVATPDSRTKSFSKADIYVFDPAAKKTEKLVAQQGPDASPIWSPDGKTIAFTSNMGSESYFVNREICTIPAAGGKITCLTEKFDENAGPLAWKKEGIFFAALQGMSRHIFLLDPRSGETTPITRGDGLFLTGMSLCRKGKILAFTYTDGNRFHELYYSRTAKFKPVKLTAFSDQLKNWDLAVKETVSWKSKDGAEITGVLIKPANFDPQKKYPLFVIIHGGPTGISYPQKIDGYNRYYPIEQWAAKGAVFLEPNYRGSAGFGADFRKLNYRNLGVGDYWDVITGVDYLVDQGFVDKDRVASMGWSQGGYISAYITTFSDRFKAVSVGAGISDWVTYYYRTDITPFTLHYLGENPWKDPDIYQKTSPMTHIKNAKTPTLIQHGEFDQRVPVTNAYKLYRGLQDMKVPSKLIIYKGFGHGITRPKENLAVLTHNWQWFNKYIFGEEPEEEKFEEEREKDKDREEEDKPGK